MSKCGFCKNCEHWYGDQLGDKRICESDKVYMGYHHNTVKLPADSVHIEDDEGWGWYTGPEFGCIHFEHRK